MNDDSHAIVAKAFNGCQRLDRGARLKLEALEYFHRFPGERIHVRNLAVRSID